MQDRKLTDQIARVENDGPGKLEMTDGIRVVCLHRTEILVHNVNK